MLQNNTTLNNIKREMIITEANCFVLITSKVTLLSKSTEKNYEKLFLTIGTVLVSCTKGEPSGVAFRL